MSAVFGILNLTGLPVNDDISTRVSNALKQHGPERDTQWGEAGIMLGHRLMAFTPEDRFGEGIEYSDCGRYVLTGEGRIDNREELIEQLGLDSRGSVLWSDNRFMLKAYERWGHEVGRHLYGGFCFALWDRQRRTLSLIRDPLGYHHSLFYHQGSGFIAFSTAIKGLLAIPEVPRILNKEKLADFLILNHTNHDTTHYQGISRLPPAHYLEIDASSGTLDLKRYWQPDMNKRIRFAKDEDYVEAFNEVFNRCVTDNLRSITPVAAFMSGGIDSSAVATTAAVQLRLQGKRLHTYTAVPRQGFDRPARAGHYNDETPFVNSIARMHDNLVTHFIDAPGGTPLDNLGQYFDAHEAPFRNPCNRVWLEAIMRKGQSSNRRVMLNGQSGNMTLSWDGIASLPDWLRRGRFVRFYQGLKSLPEKRLKSQMRYLKQAIATALPGMFWYGHGRWRRIESEQMVPKFTGINPEFALAQRVLERAREDGFSIAYRAPSNGRSARWRVLAGIDYRGDLVAGDRAAFRVDQRDPTGDRRLIEFCLAISQAQFLGHGEHQWLVKRALADRLPEVVLYKQLSGDQDPGWYERLTEVRQQMFSQLCQPGKSTEKSQALDLKKLTGFFADWPDENDDWNSHEHLVDYRMCLMRSFMVSAFLDWFEDGA